MENSEINGLPMLLQLSKDLKPYDTDTWFRQRCGGCAELGYA